MFFCDMDEVVFNFMIIFCLCYASEAFGTDVFINQERHAEIHKRSIYRDESLPQTHQYICNHGTDMECKCGEADLTYGVREIGGSTCTETLSPLSSDNFIHNSVILSLKPVTADNLFRNNVSDSLKETLTNALNSYCPGDRFGAYKCNINMTGHFYRNIFTPDQIVIFDLFYNKSSSPGEMEVAIFAMYYPYVHKTDSLTSESPTVTETTTDNTIKKFMTVRIDILETVLDILKKEDVYSSQLDFEVISVRHYFIPGPKPLPLNSIITGSVFGVLLVFICIISAIKASRDREAIKTRIAAKEEKRRIIEQEQGQNSTQAEGNGFPSTKQYVDRLFKDVQRRNLQNNHKVVNGDNLLANGVQHNNIEVHIECEVHSNPPANNGQVPGTKDVGMAEDSNYLQMSDNNMYSEEHVENESEGKDQKLRIPSGLDKQDSGIGEDRESIGVGEDSVSGPPVKMDPENGEEAPATKVVSPSDSGIANPAFDDGQV